MGCMPRGHEGGGWLTVMEHGRKIPARGCQVPEYSTRGAASRGSEQGIERLGPPAPADLTWTSLSRFSITGATCQLLSHLSAPPVAARRGGCQIGARFSLVGSHENEPRTPHAGVNEQDAPESTRNGILELRPPQRTRSTVGLGMIALSRHSHSNQRTARPGRISMCGTPSIARVAPA
jgi:hypothetical protein